MANLTITLDDEILKRARIRALEQGTSVNALLRAYLEAYAGAGIGQTAAARFAARARQARSGSGAPGRSWTRDDLYDR